MSNITHHGSTLELHPLREAAPAMPVTANATGILMGAVIVLTALLLHAKYVIKRAEQNNIHHTVLQRMMTLTIWPIRR